MGAHGGAIRALAERHQQSVIKVNKGSHKGGSGGRDKKGPKDGERGIYIWGWPPSYAAGLVKEVEEIVRST